MKPDPAPPLPCRRKRAYRTRMDAIVGMALIFASRGTEDAEITDTYRCSCGAWHVGRDRMRVWARYLERGEEVA